MTRLAAWAAGSRRADALQIAPVLAVVGAALALAWPLLPPTYPFTWDGLLHLYRAIDFFEALRAGVVWPRIAASLNYGYGYPAYDFYSPGLYFLAALPQALGADAAAALKAITYLAGVLAGLGAYGYARRWLDRGPAALAGILYLAAPYHVFDLYARGGLPEALAYAALPLLFRGLAAALDRPGWAATLVLAGSASLIVLVHNLTAFLILPFVALYLVVRLPRRLTSAGNGGIARSVFCLIAAGLLTTLLTTIHTLPAIADRGAVQLARLTQIDFGRNFIPPAQLVVPDLLPRYGGWVDTAVGGGFHLLQAAALIAGVAAWWRVRHRPGLRWEMAAQLPIALLALFLTTTPSAPAWRVVPALDLAQFPWRYLAFAALPAAFLGGAAVQAVGPRGRPIVALAAGALFVGLTSRISPTQANLPASPTMTDSLHLELAYGPDAGSTGEFLPAGVDRPPRTSPWALAQIAGWAAPDSPDRPLPRSKATADRRTYRTTDWPGGPATLDTLAFPAWEATVDGLSAPIDRDPASGLIRVDLPPGAHEIALRFVGTALQNAAALISAATALLVLPLVFVVGLKKAGWPVWSAGVAPAPAPPWSAGVAPAPRPVPGQAGSAIRTGGRNPLGAQASSPAVASLMPSTDEMGTTTGPAGMPALPAGVAPAWSGDEPVAPAHGQGAGATPAFQDGTGAGATPALQAAGPSASTSPDEVRSSTRDHRAGAGPSLERCPASPWRPEPSPRTTRGGWRRPDIRWMGSRVARASLLAVLTLAPALFLAFRPISAGQGEWTSIAVEYPGYHVTGYRLPSKSVRPGDRLDFALRWSGADPGPGTRVFARLINRTSLAWATAVAPANRVGDQVTDLSLALPVDTPPGSYLIQIGFRDDRGPFPEPRRDQIDPFFAQLDARVGPVSVQAISASATPAGGSVFDGAIALTAARLGSRAGAWWRSEPLDWPVLATDDTVQAPSGSVIHGEWHWVALQDRLPDYAVRFRLVDAAGQVWASQTTRPVDGLYPATYWRAADRVLDQQDIYVPPDVPPGRYSVDLQVLRDGGAVSVTGAGGPPGREAVIVGSVDLGVPAAWPDPAAFQQDRIDRPLAAGLRLLTGRLDRATTAPGGQVVIESRWLAAGPIGRDLLVRWDLVDAQGRSWGRTEAPPTGRDGFPTSRWAPDTVVQGRHTLALDPLVPPGEYGVRLTVIDAAGREVLARSEVLRLSVGPAESSAAPGGGPSADLGPGRAIGAVFGGAIELVGWRWDRSVPEVGERLPAGMDSGRPLSPGQRLEARLIWRGTAPVATDYTVFVQVLDAAGRLIAQHDGPPQDGQRPTSGWRTGEYLADSHTIALPGDLPPGRYRLIAGLYHPVTGARLPAASGGATFADLGEIEVAGR